MTRQLDRTRSRDRPDRTISPDVAPDIAAGPGRPGADPARAATGAASGGRRIMVAPTGARRSKADHPALPVTIDEIAACARACQRAGANAIHLHVRDEAGRHSLDPALYAEAIAAVAEAAPGMAIQVSTEAAGRFDVAEQRRSLETLVPPAASVAARELARDPAQAQRLLAFAREAGIALQLILYETADLALLGPWQAAGLLTEPPADVLLVLGRYQPPQPACPQELAERLRALTPRPARWMVCAFGPAEHAVLLEAARAGGDLRVGFENNTLRPDGTPARDNAENVAGLVRALAAADARPQAPGRAEDTPEDTATVAGTQP